MTTHHHEETTTMRVPPSPDATTPTDRTPEPVRVETITDRAAIRDSDEADERHDCGTGLCRKCSRDFAPERVPATATVAALDLDAIRDRAKRAAFGWGAEWRTETVQDGPDCEWSIVHADGKRDMVGCEDEDVTLHIAGMDPATTLALVDALARVIREAEALRAQVAAVEAVASFGHTVGDQDVPTLVSEVRRLRVLCIPLTDLSQELDMARQNLHHARAMSAAHFERAEREKTRAESAEAEVVTLRAQVAAVEALHVESEGWCVQDAFGWPCPTVRALATTGEGK